MGLEKIGELRKALGITLEDLSLRSGVPVSTIKKISAGITKNPNLETVKALARALGCTLDDLDEKENPEPGRFEVSDHEKLLIMAYRADPAMQTAVDKLLGIAGAELPPNFEEIRQHANEMAKNLFKNQPTPAEK